MTSRLLSSIAYCLVLATTSVAIASPVPSDRASSLSPDREIIAATTVERYDIDGIASTPGDLKTGARVLVGPDPTGAFAGHEGELAARTQFGWSFLTPDPGDQAFDRGNDEQYLYTGDRSLFGGLWVDSTWRRLTPQRPKWIPAGGLGRDIALTSANHGEWFFVSAYDGDFTITLPNPFAGDLSGMTMEIVLEPFDGASGTAYLEVEGGGLILGPDGQTTTRYALPRLTGRDHVFRAVAGHVASGATWYLVAGP